MKKYLKIFPAQDCPICGSDLMVTTSCDPEKDTDFESFFNDEDDVYCIECKYKSIVSVTDGEAWVQD